VATVTRRRARLERAFDGDYWLSRCQGFRIEARGDWVGVVEDVRYESRIDRPDWLAIRCRHRLSRRRRIVSVDRVAAIFPGEGLIVLER
jgi:hypothetical protein